MHDSQYLKHRRIYTFHQVKAYSAARIARMKLALKAVHIHQQGQHHTDPCVCCVRQGLRPADLRNRQYLQYSWDLCIIVYSNQILHNSTFSIKRHFILLRKLYPACSLHNCTLQFPNTFNSLYVKFCQQFWRVSAVFVFY